MSDLGLHLDIDRLGEAHPRLPRSTARELRFRAGLGLQRSRHVSGVALHALDRDAPVASRVTWILEDLTGLDQLDDRQVTEWGAEAIALGFLAARGGWQVRRRMQQASRIDWLMARPGSEGDEVTGVEVSGVATGRIGGRTTVKATQAAASPLNIPCVAIVVGFERPELVVRSSKEAV